MRQQSRQRNSFFSSRFYIKSDASGVFTGYDTVCKQSLQLKKSLCWTDLKKSDKKECLRGASAAWRRVQ